MTLLRYKCALAKFGYMLETLSILPYSHFHLTPARELGFEGAVTMCGCRQSAGKA